MKDSIDDYSERKPAAQLRISSHNETPGSYGKRTLIVDDDDSVKELFTLILMDEGYLVESASSAEAALTMLANKHFDVMLTDIMMPGMNGFELLNRVHRLAPELPIILITGHATVEMARRALTAGASDFVTKPCSPIELPIIIERNLARHRISSTLLQDHESEMRHTYDKVLDVLLAALDTRDTETEGHSQRVTAYSKHLGVLAGLEEEEILHLEQGALLHDIGKIGVPDRILHKPGALTPEEWTEIRKHPVIGHNMCSTVDFLKDAAEIVLSHHERWDGNGYPNGLKSYEIPLGARIFPLADTLDAMTMDRPYRSAVSFEEARNEILRCSGKQFDSRLVEIFLSVSVSKWQSIREQVNRSRSVRSCVTLAS